MNKMKYMVITIFCSFFYLCQGSLCMENDVFTFNSPNAGNIRIENNVPVSDTGIPFTRTPVPAGTRPHRSIILHGNATVQNVDVPGWNIFFLGNISVGGNINALGINIG